MKSKLKKALAALCGVIIIGIGIGVVDDIYYKVESRKVSVRATTEFFDVMLQEAPKNQHFSEVYSPNECFSSIVCRKATSHEVRKDDSVYADDLMLDTTSINNRMIRVSVGEILRDAEATVYPENTYQARLTRFGLSMDDVSRDDCTIWVESIIKVLKEKNCRSAKVVNASI